MSLVRVKSQICHGISQYDRCSTNSACGCLHMAGATDAGICGFLYTPCSELVACTFSNNLCYEPDHICVRHPRCFSHSVCYPISLIDQRICPPAQMTNTASPTTTTTLMSTTTSPLIISNYTSVLASYSEKYARPGAGGTSPNYYYEAIPIIVDKKGTYDIKSLSAIDTYGFLYHGTFYPSSPSVNLIYQDDDSGGNYQFRLLASLGAGVSYTLVVSTHGPLITGSYLIVAAGPGDVQFNPIDTISTESDMIATGPTSLALDYSSALTYYSEQYARPNAPSSSNYYYEAIQLIVKRTGSYTFTSKSSIDTYGYIYRNNFYPYSPSFNILVENDDGGGNLDFKLTYSLQAGGIYILVVTTHRAGVTGSFGIVTSDPGMIDFIPLNNLSSAQTTDDGIYETISRNT